MKKALFQYIVELSALGIDFVQVNHFQLLLSKNFHPLWKIKDKTSFMDLFFGRGDEDSQKKVNESVHLVFWEMEITRDMG